MSKPDKQKEGDDYIRLKGVHYHQEGTVRLQVTVYSSFHQVHGRGPRNSHGMVVYVAQCSQEPIANVVMGKN